MILLLYFLTVLTLGRCLDQLPSKLEIESSINRTIDEVERLMKSDPNLPRLSRNQIVDILQNITSKDMENYEESIEQMRSDYQRALMVVLPYNSKDSSGDDLKDLYTKPPMVQLIPDSEIMLPFASIQEENQFSSNDHKNYGNFLDVELDSNPEKFAFDLANLRQKTHTTEKSKLEVIYSPSVKESSTPSHEIVSSTIPPTRSTVNILTSDQWRYNAPPSTTPRPARPSTRASSMPATINNVTSHPKKLMKTPSKNKPFLPTVISAVPTSGSYTKPSNSYAEFKPSPSPEVITFDMAAMMNDEPSVPMYVTPMSSSPQKTLTTEVNSTPMRTEVANLLASIGLQPTDKTNSKERINSLSEGNLFGEDFAIPESNFIPTKFVGLTSISPDLPFIGQQNTFENSQTDFRQSVSNLSPDLQSLFQRFGLPVSGQEVTTTRPKKEPKPVRPTIGAWRSFKPLPTAEIKDEGMRSFLATFGLVGDGRDKKAMKTVVRSTTAVPSVIEAVPDEMKRILDNIGLITRSKSSGRSELQRTTGNSKKLHVFKPHETRISDEKQKGQINELLDTVKLVQEGKANVTDVRDAANRLLMSTTTLQGGPDPVSLEEILQRYNADLRKDVKRQETVEQEKLGEMATSDSTDSEMSASDISESTMSPTATSSKATASSSDASGDSSNSEGRVVYRPATIASAISSTEGPSLDDLADSFGGTTAEPDPVLPTPRRSGLYFLVDWNSFLEVGEEDKDKVNLRFAPKAGDRTRFISVTVP